MAIIVCSEEPIKHGRGDARSIYTLFADTKIEVPETGAATAYAIEGFNKTIPPTTLLFTSSFEFAILGNDDKWAWKS